MLPPSLEAASAPHRLLSSGDRAARKELPSGEQLLEPSSGATSKGESTQPLLGNDGSFPLLDLLIHQTLGQNYSDPCLWSPRRCAGWGCGPSPGCRAISAPCAVWVIQWAQTSGYCTSMYCQQHIVRCNDNNWKRCQATGLLGPGLIGQFIPEHVSGRCAHTQRWNSPFFYQQNEFIRD